MPYIDKIYFNNQLIPEPRSIQAFSRRTKSFFHTFAFSMAGNKDEGGGQDAAERIKVAALSAAKGLSRAQAERAAAAAVRNVNAYGQKEEGPSRWQERKEAKRQMYLMSTEKQVRLGERKDSKSSVSITGAVSQCQKCFQTGHWTYECKNERVYISRPSRTQQLKNPKLRMKVSISYDLDNPDIPKEEKAEKRVKKSKRKHKSNTGSDNDSEASVFESDSDASSVTGSDDSAGGSESSYSSSTDSEEERRRKRKNKKKKLGKRRHRRYSSSPESSESYSATESDSDDKSSRRRSKSRRHGKKH